jgi:hypothetical protein
MGPPEMLRELSALARRLGVGLRFDEFEATLGNPARRGGLCRLRGQSMIVVDLGIPLLDQIEVVAGALSTFDLEKVFVPPELRVRLERRQAGLGPVRPRPGPTLRKARSRPRAQG